MEGFEGGDMAYFSALSQHRSEDHTQLRETGIWSRMVTGIGKEVMVISKYYPIFVWISHRTGRDANMMLNEEQQRFLRWRTWPFVPLCREKC